MKIVKIKEIIECTTSKYEGIVINRNWGEKGLFFNPGKKLPKGVYILTFKETTSWLTLSVPAVSNMIIILFRTIRSASFNLLQK